METWRIVGIVVCSILLVPISIGVVWSWRMWRRMDAALKSGEKKP